ncbi:hypothetical protein S83_054947, partial [Arachis hypogaea]
MFFFCQGQLDAAENIFLATLQEAKEGFGPRDPHVASSCNNLAELYRIKKDFSKAEPLYLEAIDILEEAFGPDDIRQLHRLLFILRAILLEMQFQVFLKMWRKHFSKSVGPNEKQIILVE